MSTAASSSTAQYGASSQRPWSGVPNKAANSAGESKRGTHHQSTDPCRETSGPLRMLDSRA